MTTANPFIRPTQPTQSKLGSGRIVFVLGGIVALGIGAYVWWSGSPEAVATTTSGTVIVKERKDETTKASYDSLAQNEPVTPRAETKADDKPTKSQPHKTGKRQPTLDELAVKAGIGGWNREKNGKALPEGDAVTAAACADYDAAAVPCPLAQ